MGLICWRSLFLVVVVFSIANSTFSADPLVDGPEQKVLGKWVGNWRVSYEVLKAEWTPETKVATAELTTRRVVGGRFVQETSEHSDKSSASKILTYDGEKKCYRGWWFSSTGQTSESTGTWDDGAKTMTWTSVAQTPFTTTVKERFLDDDNLAWVVSVTDSKGKVLFGIEGKSVRVKEPKK